MFASERSLDQNILRWGVVGQMQIILEVLDMTKFEHHWHVCSENRHDLEDI